MSQPKKNSATVVLGLVIIVVGLILLVDLIFKGFNADVIMAKWWPLLIFIFGAIFASASPKAGIITMLFGALLLLAQMGLLGSSIGRHVVAFLIILLGLVLLVTSFGPRKKSDSNLPPPRND